MTCFDFLIGRNKVGQRVIHVHAATRQDQGRMKDVGNETGQNFNTPHMTQGGARGREAQCKKYP